MNESILNFKKDIVLAKMASKMQVKIVKYFIKSSPVGEVNMVLNDVCNIIDREILNNADIQTALKEYFETHK